MSEATVTCRICEQEESYTVGWDLYKFAKSDTTDNNEHNICDQCINDILVSVFKGEIERLDKANNVLESAVITKYLKNYIREISHKELDRSLGNRE